MNKTTYNVLIYEPDYSGHRLNFVRLMIEAMSELPVRVVLVADEHVAQQEEYAVHLRNLAGKFELQPVSTALDADSARGYALARLKELPRFCRQFQADHLYVPVGDGLLQAMAARSLLGRRMLPENLQAETILFKGGFAYPQKTYFQRAKAWLTLRGIATGPWSRVHILDPLAAEWIASHRPDLAGRAPVLPDPAELNPELSRTEARSRLGLPAHEKVVTCAGVMTPRKGAGQLIEAFAKADEPGSHLLLAGKMKGPFGAHVLASLQQLRNAGRVTLIDEYLSDEDFSAAIQAADVVAVPYPNHRGSSGILLLAVAAERPVVSGQYGWVGEAVRRLELGIACDVSDAGAFSDAIKHSLKNSDIYRHGSLARRYKTFCQPSNFKRIITARLRYKLGLSLHPEETGMGEQHFLGT